MTEGRSIIIRQMVEFEEQIGVHERKIEDLKSDRDAYVREHGAEFLGVKVGDRITTVSANFPEEFEVTGYSWSEDQRTIVVRAAFVRPGGRLSCYRMLPAHCKWHKVEGVAP